MSVLKMFEYLQETPERWDEFVTATSEIRKINKEWWGKLIAEIPKQWRALNIEKWNGAEAKFDSKNNEIWFYLGEDHNTMRIRLEFNFKHYDKGGLSVEEGDSISNKKLREWEKNNPEKIKKINQLLGIEGGLFVPDYEEPNISFNDNGTIKTDIDELAWYAGNRTDEFAKQLIERVVQLQTPEMTAIFEEINKECVEENKERTENNDFDGIVWRKIPKF
ncbi:MAG: hypothetical protein Q4A09_04515 [Capnocytophaga felis]|nr:hypothetical protein [Capnocytophaga felis]